MNEEIITQGVRAFYQRFPYPNYPLLAKPRIQEAYLAPASFAAALAKSSEGLGVRGWQSFDPSPQRETRILVAGCGDIQPYAFAAWEARQHRLVFLDLSASSLRRARLRCARLCLPWSWRSSPSWVTMDLQAYLEGVEPESLQHCDAYGVLHHLATPSRTVKSLGEAVAPGGTLRLMVYNSLARRWIHELQKVFRLFGLSAFNADDRSDAVSLLALLQTLPQLQRYFAGLGEAYKHNASRLVDTFMHVREIRWPLEPWWSALSEAGFRPLGLFDRYGELDELPNPLWHMPTLKELSERSQDGRFENNFEFFLVKGQKERDSQQRKHAGKIRYPFLPLAPPRAWFSFEETKSIGAVQRMRLWRNFIQHVRCGKVLTNDEIVSWRSQIPLVGLQRLARIGAVLPGMILEESFASELKQAIATNELPSRLDKVVTKPSNPCVLLPEALRAKVLNLARKKNLSSDSKKVRLILLRFIKLLSNIS